MDGIAVEHIEVKASRLVEGIEDIVNTVTREHEEWTIAQVKRIDARLDARIDALAKRIDALMELIASLKPPPSATAPTADASGSIDGDAVSPSFAAAIAQERSERRRTLISAVKAWFAESGRSTATGTISSLITQGVFGNTTLKPRAIGTIMRGAADPDDFDGVAVIKAPYQGTFRWTFTSTADPTRAADIDTLRTNTIAAWIGSEGGRVTANASAIRDGLISAGLWAALGWSTGHSLAAHLRKIEGSQTAMVIVEKIHSGPTRKTPQWRLRLRENG